MAGNYTRYPNPAAVPAPAGSATAANQVLEIDELTDINGKLGSLGQKNMAGSAPVVLASDQSSIPVAATLQAGTALAGFVSQAGQSGNTNALSRAASTALATNLVIKGSAGRLYSLVITNTKATAQFIQIHNSATLPSDTAIPIYSFYIQPQSTASLSVEDFGDYFSTGIVACNSSTAATKTIGSADCWFVARYL